MSLKKKSFLLLISLVGYCFLVSPAFACWCDDSKKTAMTFNDAYRDASLVILGKVEEITWKGAPTSKIIDWRDGTKIEIFDYVDPLAPDQPYEPKAANSILGYKTVIRVEKVWKDGAKRVIENLVAVSANGLGWCGFQFEKDKRYLIYARDGGFKDSIPVASVCSRTRPFEYGTDDIQKLDKLNKK